MACVILEPKALRSIIALLTQAKKPEPPMSHVPCSLRALILPLCFSTLVGAFTALSPSLQAQTDAPSDRFGLTGDWGGHRSSLTKQGVDFYGSYAGEWFGVARGGKSTGSVVDGLLKLQLDLRMEPLIGWEGASFRMSFLAPQGTSGSVRHAGDLSVFSNLDAYDTFRLVDLWLEQRVLENKLSIKVGQMRVDDEFGVTNSAAMFVNSSFGVPNLAVTRMPYASYPIGALGVRGRVEPVSGFYAQIGLYDGNPSSGDYADPTTGLAGGSKRHGTDWALRHSEGALWAAEVGYERSGDSYPGAVRFGFMHHTDGFQSISVPGRIDGSNRVGYFVLDQTVWQKSGSAKEGISLFLRGVTAPESRNEMSRSFQAGVNYSGLTVEGDQLGLAYARNRMSRFSDVGNEREALVELSYQVPIMSYLKLQPDLQWISRPGASREFDNAWVIGLRAIVEF